MCVRSLGQEDLLEVGMTTRSWRIPDRVAWQATVHRVVKGRTQLKQLSKQYTHRNSRTMKVPSCQETDARLKPPVGFSGRVKELW